MMDHKFKVGDRVRYVGKSFPHLTKEDVGVVVTTYYVPTDDTFPYDVDFSRLPLIPCSEKELELITNG